MTSTTSSSNKNFAKLFKWAFARNKSIIIVYSILMVIGIIIDLYITSVVTRDSSNYNPIDMEIRANGTLGNVSIMIAQLGAVLLSIISAVHTFSFLHNKRSTDMFGSIPATRTTLYFSHLLAGIVSVSIPFTAGSLAVTGFTCRSLTFLGYDLMIILDSATPDRLSAGKDWRPGNHQWILRTLAQETGIPSAWPSALP